MRISDWSSDVCSSDLPGLIIWAPNHISEGIAGFHGSLSAIVELSAPAPAGGVTLSYRTVDGSAKAGSDYTAVSGTLEIPEGEKVAFKSEEHTSELQSLMRISYAVSCLKTTNYTKDNRY